VRARLLAQLHGPERFAPFAAEVARAFSLPVADAQEALRLVQGSEGWVPGLWPGSQIFFTPQLIKANTVISRLAPGTRIPRHLHGTRELTYVLDGVLLEDDATRHSSGTCLDMPAGSEHDVGVPADADCLVVFSVARP
jgi:anti-sigma factor ChrR (cupin superfamily)